LTAQSVVFVYKEQDLLVSLLTYNFSTYIVGKKTTITNKKNDKCLSKWETEAIDQTIYHTKTERHLLGQSYSFSPDKQKWEGFDTYMVCVLSWFGYSICLQCVGVTNASLCVPLCIYKERFIHLRQPI